MVARTPGAMLPCATWGYVLALQTICCTFPECIRRILMAAEVQGRWLQTVSILATVPHTKPDCTDLNVLFVVRIVWTRVHILIQPSDFASVLDFFNVYFDSLCSKRHKNFGTLMRTRWIKQLQSNTHPQSHTHTH
jgi:hypothetical protein